MENKFGVTCTLISKYLNFYLEPFAFRGNNIVG